MKYMASVKDKRTKERMIITSEYPTKKSFHEDLIGNGYTIYFISTEENFDRDCETYHRNYDLQKMIKKMRYETDKKFAAKRNMSVAEYREWLKA